MALPHMRKLLRRLKEKALETIAQLGSLGFDAVLLIGWYFSIGWINHAFKWIAKAMGPEYEVGGTEHEIVENARLVLTWGALATLMLYLLVDFVKLIVRKIREIVNEYKDRNDDDQDDEPSDPDRPLQ